MSDEREQTALEEQAGASSESTSPEDDEDVGSPFDHPAFLPVLLTALAVWFGWDGWFSETIEAVTFNRYGFFFLLGFAIYFAVSEVTRIPFLLPMLWVVFALWLTAFMLIGSEDSWWRGDPEALVSETTFNQFGAAFCALAAIFYAIREARSTPNEPDGGDGA